jgi:DHA1 family bicyclomycin/chloramphenicol resistance-like MFS transporter
MHQQSKKTRGKKGTERIQRVKNMIIPLSTRHVSAGTATMEYDIQQQHFCYQSDTKRFFLFNAVGILFWGPLRDKFGRRPVLLIAVSLNGCSFRCISG